MAPGFPTTSWRRNYRGSGHPANRREFRGPGTKTFRRIPEETPKPRYGDQALSRRQPSATAFSSWPALVQRLFGSLAVGPLGLKLYDWPVTLFTGTINTPVSARKLVRSASNIKTTIRFIYVRLVVYWIPPIIIYYARYPFVPFPLRYNFPFLPIVFLAFYPLFI